MNRSESKYFNTARRMDEALLALLEEKDFAYITVREICARAGVNRSTFYLHYENMSDLLRETVEMIDERFRASVADATDDKTGGERLAGLPREELFLLLCLAAAGVCAVLAFRFAVPLQAQTPQTLPDTKELAAYTQVELNTADADALCTLPGVGPHNAQAILDYRAQHGPFAQVEDAAQVPGITQAMVDSWAGQAYVR